MNQRGITRERQVRKLLEAEGWIVARCAGSKGEFDLMASRGSWYAMSSGAPTGDAPETFLVEVRLIEVKSTAGGPYERFSPADRVALVQRAREAGAAAWLAWWPKNGKLTWIAESEWPAVAA